LMTAPLRGSGLQWQPLKRVKKRFGNAVKRMPQH